MLKEQKKELKKIRKSRNRLMIAIFVTGIILLFFAEKDAFLDIFFKNTTGEVDIPPFLSLVIEIIKEISVALIVAGTVIFVVEFKRTEQIQAEHSMELEQSTVESKEALKSLIKQSSEQTMLLLMADKKIADEVQENIIRQHVIRRKMQIYLLLQEIENEPGYLLKTQTMTYEIDNLTMKSTPEKIFHFEEFVPNSTRFMEFELSFINKKSSEKEVKTFKNEELAFDEKSDSKLVKLSKKSQHLELKYIAEIEGNVLTKVRLKLEGKVKTEQLYLIAPPRICDGLNVTVFIPDNISVSALPNHPREEEFRESKMELPNQYSWELSAGLLPYQGIQLKWQEKTSQS